VDFDSHRKICDRAIDRAAQPLPSGVTARARILVRGRLWRLDAVDSHEDCRELQLTSAEDGDTRVLLWPFDRPVARTLPQRPDVLRARAWLRRVGRIAASDRAPIHLLTRSGPVPAAILPYQLLPALEVAAGARHILLADEVGLGKTAQAGWIIADTIARQRDARVLIAVPAGLRAQWADELARLFTIETVAADARWLISAVNDLPRDVNVWTPPGVYLVSLDFLKRPDIAASARDVIWDLLVVDEAHVAAAPTERHRALAPIARRSRVVTLLTATPFSGDAASFASLTSLGATGAQVPLMFRRSRADVGDARARRHRFVRVRLTPVEQRLQRMLQRYCHEVWKDAPSATGRLAAIVLRKRALSSPGALERSLQRRLRLLSPGVESVVQLSLFAEDVDAEDDEPSGVLAAAGLLDASRERRWLEELIDAARCAAAANSKLEYLKRLLRRMPGEAAVVFTEFRDTLCELAGVFPSSLRIHGGMGAAERSDVQAHFNAAGGLLFATDAAAYGLNLHGRCRVVVNFELPWNPARLEQRIGRVDRIGQARPVIATTLVARDTAEDFVVANVARRLWKIAGSFGVDDRLAALLDDARIAGMVVGGEPVCELPSSCTVPSVQVPVAAIDEARRLTRLTADDASRGRSTPDEKIGVAIASVRSTTALRSGFVAILEWTLREPAGRLVACRTLAMHVPGSPHRPRTAADARALALSFVTDYGECLRMRAIPELEQARSRAADAHGRALQSQIQRETQLLNDTDTSALLQPGLFDQRVVRNAAAADGRLSELRAETQRRIDRLLIGAALEDHLAIRAVLIVWSDRK
jgi:superfamily II DNA or RNA helicase